MKPRTYDPKSSFFRLATVYNLMSEREIEIFEISKTNICEYSSKVFKGFLWALLTPVLIAFGLGTVVDFSLWIYTGLMYAWVTPHVLASVFILALGLTILGFVCYGVEAVWKAFRNRSRHYKEKKSSFVKDAVYSLHNKVCFEINFKKEESNE